MVPQQRDLFSNVPRPRLVLSRRRFVEVTAGLSVTLLGGLVAACTPSAPAAPSSTKDPAKPAPTEASKPAAPAAQTQPTAPKPAEVAKPADAAKPVAPAQAGQVTLRIQDWHFTEKTWGAFEREMLEDFKKANPNIAVEPDAVPY